MTPPAGLEVRVTSYSAVLSEYRPCFQGGLFLDGKAIAYLFSDGWNRPTEISPYAQSLYDNLLREFPEMESWVDTQAQEHIYAYDPTPNSVALSYPARRSTPWRNLSCLQNGLRRLRSSAG